MILNHLDCADYRFAPTPLVLHSMFRTMVVGRTQQAKSAEARVILIALNEFLSARKLQPCVPKLAYGVRKKQDERWSAPGLRDELVAFVQQRIHCHRAATGCSDRLDESRTLAWRPSC